MPTIQKSTNKKKNVDGEVLAGKFGVRYSITIPSSIITLKNWKKGDELEFKEQDGFVILRKKVQ